MRKPLWVILSAGALFAVNACRSAPPRIEPVAGPPAAVTTLECVSYELDDSASQLEGPIWAHLSWEARREGAQVISLFSRTTCPQIGLDETGTVVLSVDVRTVAPETPGRVLTVFDSGFPVLVSKSFRLLLKEGSGDLPSQAAVTPWAEVPPGAASAGLSLTLACEGGTLLGWTLANAGTAPVRWIRDVDGVVDRGCFSLHVVGPDGHLLPAKEGEGGLPPPRIEEVPAGGSVKGRIDLARARDLPEVGTLRVILIYSSYACPARHASYAAGLSWPNGWTGALASNELVVRVTRE